jgi:hypothetical protein
LEKEKVRKKYNRLESNGDLLECFMMLVQGDLRGFDIELVLYVGMGFIAQCVSDGKEQMAASLTIEMLKALRSLLAADTHIDIRHKSLIEAMVFETAIGCAHAFPNSATAGAVAEWFEAASNRYHGMHVARYMRCCNRYACFLGRIHNHKQAIEVLVKACEQRGYTGNMYLIAELNLAAAIFNSGSYQNARDEWKCLASIRTSHRNLQVAISNIGAKINSA